MFRDTDIVRVQHACCDAAASTAARLTLKLHWNLWEDEVSVEVL